MSPKLNASFALTLVVRGQKERLIEMRKKLRILAIEKEVSQSELLISIILNYLDQQPETQEAVR